MNAFRKAPWFPLASVLLLAVVLAWQAAGCCKMGSLVATWMPAAEAAATPATMAAGHSCCPKPNSAQGVPSPEAPAPEAAECGSGDGCCLQGMDHRADPGLASSPAPTRSALISVLAFPATLAGETPAVAPRLPALEPPADAGPPLWLSQRRLLI